MHPLSDFSRGKKERYFLDAIRPEERVLEIGAGSGWVGEFLKRKGCAYVSIDVLPPADIVGDIREWKQLGLEGGSFDVIVAFEVVEHVHCFDEARNLLRKGGRFMFTTPVPKRDWILKMLEFLKLNQKRTSPHSCLIDARTVEGFSDKKIRIVAGLSQWGIFTT